MNLAIESGSEATPLPPPDWRDDLIASYQGDGFMIVEVVAQPPYHPVKREQWLRGQEHEFTQTELPYTNDEDTRLEADYKAAMQRHRQAFGENNVRTAFPTAGMQQEHPEYTERPYEVIMARTGGPPVLN